MHDVTCAMIVHAIRYMKMELRHLTFINPELDGGNVCPACPKVRM